MVNRRKEKSDEGLGRGLTSPPLGAFSIREFARNEAAGGLFLFACAVIALLWANSPWHDAYDDLWNAHVTLGTVQFHLDESLRHWVNDGLMTVFFFVVGLEIKRELLAGELASPRRAALPAIAALGGVLVPASIYAAINAGHPGADGWGVPMATDIAFALGVLAILGDRVPFGLKVFLTALAIVDDIAAVLVIALFYTSAVNWEALGVAGVILIVLFVANTIGVRRAWVYGLLGIGLWTAVFQSGVHATVAGVLLALMIPAATRFDPADFIVKGRRSLAAFERAGDQGERVLTNSARQEALAELDDAVEGAGSPLHRLEHALHPWVAFLIVPLFALANAGVRVEGGLGAALGNRVTLGVVVGLVLGKQIGVTLATWLAVRTGTASLPDGVTWRHIYGASWLAGIGFTMSLFVADLAFADDEHLLTAAKLGILVASVIAGGVGWFLLSRVDRKVASPVSEAQTAS
jgi:NhaA family Na+:H+ antiporter